MLNLAWKFKWTHFKGSAEKWLKYAEFFNDNAKKIQQNEGK